MSARNLVLLLAILLTHVPRHAIPGQPDGEAETLLAQVSRVLWLPTAESMDQMKIACQRLAAMGEKALPLLKKELRFGISYRELSVLLQKRQSHRWAATSVLALIPGKESTQLLFGSLLDPSDNGAMMMVALNELKTRDLSEDQIVGLLRSEEYYIALYAIEMAKRKASSPAVRRALEQLTRQEHLLLQFKNEYGAETLSEDGRLEIRMEAATALGSDTAALVKEIATKALKLIKSQAENPKDPDQPAFSSYASEAERIIIDNMDRLAKLGQKARPFVEAEVITATGDYAKLLDMALARLGEQVHLERVARHLVESRSAMVRFCAAMTLRKIGNPKVKPALLTALKDSYCRANGACMARDRLIHPIRIVALGALEEMGEDVERIRAAMPKDAPELISEASSEAAGQTPPPALVAPAPSQKTTPQ